MEQINSHLIFARVSITCVQVFFLRMINLNHEEANSHFFKVCSNKPFVLCTKENFKAYFRFVCNLLINLQCTRLIGCPNVMCSPDQQVSFLAKESWKILNKGMVFKLKLEQLIPNRPFYSCVLSCLAFE